MILRQLAEGRCEVENQYTRVVPYEGNLRALEVMAEVFELRPALRVARPGLHLAERPEALRGLRGLRRRAALRGAGRARRRPEGVPVRRGAQGRHQAVRVQGVRHRVHAGAARSARAWSPARAPAPPTTTTAASRGSGRSYERRSPSAEAKILGIIETARAKRAKFRDAHITMAHGAGGKATQALIEGLLAARVRVARARRARRRRHRRRCAAATLAMTTDTFVVKPIRFPGGSIGELAVNGTVNDLAVAGARPLALTLSLVLEEGLAADDAARRGRGDRARRVAAAGVRVVAGDTKVVERGHADGMYVCTTGLGQRRPARAALARGAAPRRPHPALRAGRRARHGDHARPRRVRARRGRSSPTRARCGRRSTRCSAPPAPALRCLRDATRGGVASVLNELARASGVAMVVREADVPVLPAVAGAAELLGIDPMYIANEGKLVAFVAPRARRTRRSPRCARRPAARRPPRSARSGPSRPGWCWSRPRSAAGG